MWGSFCVFILFYFVLFCFFGGFYGLGSALCVLQCEWVLGFGVQGFVGGLVGFGVQGFWPHSRGCCRATMTSASDRRSSVISPIGVIYVFPEEFGRTKAGLLDLRRHQRGIMCKGTFVELVGPRLHKTQNVGVSRLNENSTQALSPKPSMKNSFLSQSHIAQHPWTHQQP